MYILKSTMEILTRVLINNVFTLFINLFKTKFHGLIAQMVRAHA